MGIICRVSGQAASAMATENQHMGDLISRDIAKRGAGTAVCGSRRCPFPRSRFAVQARSAGILVSCLRGR